MVYAIVLQCFLLARISQSSSAWVHPSFKAMTGLWHLCCAPNSHIDHQKGVLHVKLKDWCFVRMCQALCLLICSPGSRRGYPAWLSNPLIFSFFLFLFSQYLLSLWEEANKSQLSPVWGRLACATRYRHPLSWTCYGQLVLMKSLCNVRFLSDRNGFHSRPNPFGSSKRDCVGKTLSQTNETHWCALRKIKQYKCLFSILR